MTSRRTPELPAQCAKLKFHRPLTSRVALKSTAPRLKAATLCTHVKQDRYWILVDHIGSLDGLLALVPEPYFSLRKTFDVNTIVFDQKSLKSVSLLNDRVAVSGVNDSSTVLPSR